MSLRRRLLIGFAVVAIALVAGGISIAASTRVALIDQIDRQLSDISTPVALRFGVDAVGPPPLSDPAVAASDTNQRLSEFFLAQLDADGVEIFRLAPGLASSNDPLPSATSLRSLARKATQTSAAVGNVPAADGGTFRVRVTRSRDGTGYVVVGRSLSDVERASRRVALTEAAIASAILATLGVVAWWVLRQGVRPLAEIAATADAIAGGDLSRRVSHIAPSTEAGRVGVAFNRMTEQLEDDLRQRAASQQRLKQFVADASHELRTPLTSIRGYVDLWQQGGLRDEAKLEDALRRVGDESARMSRLIDDMLLLTRLDEGLPLLDQPVDLVRLLRDCIEDALILRPERTIRCVTRGATSVRGDADRLRQVVVNLLMNAVAHTPATADIDVETWTEADNAVIEVRDRGPGMDVDDASRVFERFVRLEDGRSSTRGGSGLGLAIVAAVVASHGGSVTLHTAIGEGARFVVRLPVRGLSPTESS